MPSDHRDCFVIMPFGGKKHAQRFTDRFDQIIRPAVEGFQPEGRPFKCERAKELAAPGSIQRAFIERLRTAHLVIADLSERNANVMYELGIRHALRSGTILIAADGYKPLVDISQERIIFFNDSDALGAIEAIRRAVKALNFRTPDSPVLASSPGREQKIPEWWRSRDGDIHSPDDMWLEVLCRLEDGKPTLHFSFVRIRYDDRAHLDPFVMEGHSFSGDGHEHSEWNTEYFCFKTVDDNRIRIDYTYKADISGRDSRVGYGTTTFAGGAWGGMSSGGGYYFAAEEETPYRCRYKIRRVDDELRQRLSHPLRYEQPDELRRVVPAIKQLVESGHLVDMRDTEPRAVETPECTRAEAPDQSRDTR